MEEEGVRKVNPHQLKKKSTSLIQDMTEQVEAWLKKSTRVGSKKHTKLGALSIGYSNDRSGQFLYMTTTIEKLEGK